MLSFHKLGIIQQGGKCPIKKDSTFTTVIGALMLILEVSRKREHTITQVWEYGNVISSLNLFSFHFLISQSTRIEHAFSFDSLHQINQKDSV